MFGSVMRWVFVLESSSVLITVEDRVTDDKMVGMGEFVLEGGVVEESA